MKFLDELPHFKVVSLNSADLVVVLLLRDLAFLCDRLARARRLRCATEPFVLKHTTDVLFELEDDFLDLDAHVFLLDSF